MYQSFNAKGITTYSTIDIEVVEQSENMYILTPTLPICITKEQVMEFFDLVEADTRQATLPGKAQAENVVLRREVKLLEAQITGLQKIVVTKGAQLKKARTVITILKTCLELQRAIIQEGNNIQ